MSTEPLTPVHRCLSCDVVLAATETHRDLTGTYSCVAARAAQDVAGRVPYIGASEFTTRGARAQPVTPPPDALRDIDAEWSALVFALQRRRVSLGEIVARHRPRIEAALRAQGVVQSPDLDVERLAEALRYVERTMQFAMGIKAPEDGPPNEWYDGYARNVAKRYAAEQPPVPAIGGLVGPTPAGLVVGESGPETPEVRDAV